MASAESSHYQEKIGEGLVRIGVLTQQQCDHVLELQRQGDKRLFGEIAISLGYVRFEELIKYLSSRPRQPST